MREEIYYISDDIKLTINSIYEQTGYTDYKELAKYINGMDQCNEILKFLNLIYMS